MSALETLVASHTEAEGRRHQTQTEIDEILAGLHDDESDEDRDPTEDEQRQVETLVETRAGIDKELDELDDRLEEENKRARRRDLITEARSRQRPFENDAGGGGSDVQVTHEPMMYGIHPDGKSGSEFSFYLDHAARVQSLLGFRMDNGAIDRLSTYAHQVEREFSNDTAIGKQFGAQIREQFRPLEKEAAKRAVEETRSRGRVAQEDKVNAELRSAGGMKPLEAGVETRTVGTGGGTTATGSSQGAAFVTPIFYVAQYAPYREFGRAFIDQCNKQTLPSYGMTIYIPKVTGRAEVNEQTEGSAVPEKTPTYGFLSGTLITEAGEVVVTQQLLDRAGPNFGFDQLIFDQLERDYNPRVDKYVLTKAIEEGFENSWSGNAGAFVLVEKEAAGGLYGQLAKLKAEIRKTEGTVLAPTHIFMDPIRWEYIAAWGDGQARVLGAVPDYAGPFNAVGGGNPSGDMPFEGNTGYRMQGLPVFHDANMPKQSTTTRDQVLVGCLSEVYVYEGTPTTRAIPQTFANELRVILQKYSYITAIKRYAKAVGIVTGNALAEPAYTH